jgi:hypothetical protein
MAIRFPAMSRQVAGVIGNYSAQGKPLGSAATGPNASSASQKSQQNQQKSLINHARKQGRLWTRAKRQSPEPAAEGGGKKTGGHKGPPVRR